MHRTSQNPSTLLSGCANSEFDGLIWPRGDEVPGEAQLGEHSNDEGGPAVGVFGGADRWCGPALGVLGEPEGVFAVEVGLVTAVQQSEVEVVPGRHTDGAVAGVVAGERVVGFGQVERSEHLNRAPCRGGRAPVRAGRFGRGGGSA